ncbi:hypothetical protein EMCRGX_G010208 [Ephydatia muelleri]
MQRIITSYLPPGVLLPRYLSILIAYTSKRGPISSLLHFRTSYDTILCNSNTESFHQLVAFGSYRRSGLSLVPPLNMLKHPYGCSGKEKFGPFQGNY